MRAQPKRDLSSLFLQNAEGDLKQVGSTCIKPFLGQSSPSLAALSVLEEDTNELLESFRKRANKGEFAVTVLDALKAAIFFSNHGKDFVKARALGLIFERPTADLVFDYFFSFKTPHAPSVEVTPKIFKRARLAENSKR